MVVSVLLLLTTPLLFMHCRRTTTDVNDAITKPNDKSDSNVEALVFKQRPSPMHQNVLQYISHKKEYIRLYSSQSIKSPSLDFIRSMELMVLHTIGETYDPDSLWYYVGFKGMKGWVLLQDPIFYYHPHEHELRLLQIP